MTKNDLAQKVRAIITAQFEAHSSEPAPTITDATKPVDDLGFDSLDLVEVAMDLEDSLDLELDDGEVARLVTVGDIVSHLAERLSVAGSGCDHSAAFSRCAWGVFTPYCPGKRQSGAQVSGKRPIWPARSSTSNP